VTEKKIIAVVGATGQQGGGLMRAILDDPDGPFTARAITRNPDSAAAKALAARGAEVVPADLNHDASLRIAFEGAYGAFVVTNYWEPRTADEEAKRSPARMELQQAWNAASAAKATELKHVVWSTLEDTRPHFKHLGSDAPDLEGEYKVPHFDAKADANAYFVDLGVPTTFLETTFYYDWLIRRAHRDSDGRLVLDLPIGDRALNMVATEDIGRTAYGILLAGPRFIGRAVGLAGDRLTGEQMTQALTAVLGENVIYRPITPHQERKAEHPFAEEMANMYQFFTEAVESLHAHRDLARIRTINPRLKSFDEWLAEHRDEAKSTLL
jgi:uncharacterized protein YbjT (DUF2867 family)